MRRNSLRFSSREASGSWWVSFLLFFMSLNAPFSNRHCLGGSGYGALVLESAATKVQLDSLNHVIGGDQIHASGKSVHHVDAKLTRLVLLVSVAEGNGPRFPAAAVVAASERTDGVEELVVGIGGPVGRLAPPGHDDARPIRRNPGPARYRRRQVHQQAHGTEDPLAGVHESHELAQFGLASEVYDAVERGVVVSGLADLHELDSASKGVHHLLVAFVGPPLDRIVELAAGNEEPEGPRRSERALDPLEPAFLLIRYPDVSLEGRRSNPEAQGFVQILDEAVEEVIGSLIAPIDERIVALDDAHVRVVLAQGRDVRVVLPESGTGSSHVGEEFSRMARVQVPDRSREHDDVAR